MLKINYNYYEDNFNQTLISELRKHGSSEDYLQFWVPDDNIVIGLAGMVDSVLASGTKSFQIKVAKKSLSQNQNHEFLNLIKSTSNCKHTENGDSYEFEFSPVESICEAKSIEVKKKKIKSQVDFKKIEGVKFGVDESSQTEIIPGLKAVALSLERNLRHKVPLNTVPNCISINTENYALYLKIAIDGYVSEAYFHTEGESWRNNLLDIYCEYALGTPFQEVADHNVLKLIDELKSKDDAKLAKGILLPVNCGSFFSELIHACRQLYSVWEKEKQRSGSVNQYIPPPSDVWQKTEPAELMSRIKNYLYDYYEERGLSYSELISGIRLEKNKSKYLVRTVIQYSSSIKINRPRDLLQMENYLRQHLEKTLEVVSERISDTSPLRRLTK